MAEGHNRHHHHNHHHHHYKPVQEFVSNNVALDRKIKEACFGLKPAIQHLLLELSSTEDKELVADFILDYWSVDYGNGQMISVNTKRSYITTLVYLSRYVKNERNFGHYKSFREMTREDFMSTVEPKGFLEKHRREFADDPDQRWMGTYKTRAAKILVFWKWWTQRDLKAEERQTPPQLKGLRFPARKAKTSTKREDLWTAEEHKVFLERCEDVRLACYHAIALETGGRPSELLQLKIKDIQIKTSPSTGKKFAEFWIGAYGKNRKARPATISDAIPYLNVWKAVHPNRDDKEGNAYLFPSLEKSARYHDKPLEEDSLRILYFRTIKHHFPKLLSRPDIPLEEKATIKILLKKPSHPYLRRHEFATEIAPRVPQSVFNQLMGHSKTSNLQDVYVQDLGTEGNRELQIARGIITRDEFVAPAKLEMAPKYCPICHEANKHNADLCLSCNWVLSPKGMQEVREADAKALEEAEQTKKRLEELEAKQKAMELDAITRQQQQIEKITAALQNTQDQVGMLRQALSEIHKEENTKPLEPVKMHVLKKYNELTNPSYPSVWVEPLDQ